MLKTGWVTQPLRSPILCGRGSCPDALMRDSANWHMVLLWSTGIETYRLSIDIPLLWSDKQSCSPASSLPCFLLCVLVPLRLCVKCSPRITLTPATPLGLCWFLLWLNPTYENYPFYTRNCRGEVSSPDGLGDPTPTKFPRSLVFLPRSLCGAFFTHQVFHTCRPAGALVGRGCGVSINMSPRWG